jgi:hypothetical protein
VAKYFLEVPKSCSVALPTWGGSSKDLSAERGQDSGVQLHHSLVCKDLVDFLQIDPKAIVRLMSSPHRKWTILLSSQPMCLIRRNGRQIS